MSSYRIVNGKPYLVGNLTAPSENKRVVTDASKKSFKDILDEKINSESYGYKISNHASERLRSINFSKADYMEIQRGFDLARDKGAKNTVMVYKDVALIASVENKTIITAVEKDRAKENVFTNVDSVVIL
ncbi:TIGR02530 family flagellar biosynthesis protein [Clostridium manihotivorum]|uniref:Flagellar biosynthesis protein n=1 Tax=Clostridium manihotivorum TaxID=2320868 RepID=A0A410DRL1_9CLOT|nr:TIGR02530 family flagellar biosynthesis protein [Clostridium manihotivorum]QAA31681.1 flagellar biosynthesis protein [Clostridium manihotivorum]